MLAGLAFSLLTAVSMTAGNFMEKRAVDHMAELSVRRAGQMATSLLTSKLWLAGFVVSLVALGFQVVAYALAPLAVVQSVYGAGLVLLVAGSRVLFKEPMRRRELAGLGVIVAAVVLVGTSLGSTESVGLAGSGGPVLVVSALTVLAAALAFTAARRRSLDASSAYGTASGLFYGVAALGTKGASTLLARDGLLGSIPHLFVSPYPYLFGAASVLGLVSFQTGLQRCRIGVVAPLSSVVSSTYVVAVGMVLFGEHLPGDPVHAALRLTGFAGVLGGTLLLAGGTAGRRQARAATKVSPHVAGTSDSSIGDPGSEGGARPMKGG